MFPDGARRGAVPHRRRDAVVLPRRRALRRRVTGDRDTLRALLPTLLDIVDTTCAARASASAWIPTDGLLAPGRRGLPAHLDGRQGGRLGGDAAARQGGRDQRALVQRAAPAGAAGGREQLGRRRRSATSAATPSAPGSRSTPLLVRRRRPPLRRGRRRAGATIRRAGRTRCSRSRSTIRCSTRGAGQPVHGGGARAPAHAGRPALAGAGPSRLQGEVLRRPAVARRGLPPGHRLGLADRSVRRCLAEGPSGGPRRGARSCWTASTAHLGEACVGSISEIFDAEAPYMPRGCIAQAWSVAEVLRCWLKTA